MRGTPTGFPTILSFFRNTSLHFNRLGPFTSPWEVGEAGAGGGEGAFLWLASTVAQSQVLSARRGLETMGRTRAREPAASQFMQGKSPLRRFSGKPAIRIFPQSWNNEPLPVAPSIFVAFIRGQSPTVSETLVLYLR